MKASEVREKLFFEKSIWHILSTYEGAFPRPIKAKFAALFALVVSALLFFGASKQGVATHELASWFSGIVDLALLLASSLFGVTVAAYAIFAASLNDDLTRKLVEVEHYPSVSVLNFLFSLFAYVMTTLFLLMISSFVYKYAIAPRSILIMSFGVSDYVQWWALSVFASAFVAQIVFAISILFSFVWNVHVLLLTISGLRASE